MLTETLELSFLVEFGMMVEAELDGAPKDLFRRAGLNPMNDDGPSQTGTTLSLAYRPLAISRWVALQQSPTPLRQNRSITISFFIFGN